METAKNKFIELYPSNWLYNAGVVGFLLEGKNSELYNKFIELKNDGRLFINRDLFKKEKVNEEKDKELVRALILLVEAKVDEDELKIWLEKKSGNQIYKQKYINFFEELGEFGYKFIKCGNSLFATKTPFQNLMQLKKWQEYFLDDLLTRINERNTNQQKCGICYQSDFVNYQVGSDVEKRFSEIKLEHLKGLGGSINLFPNSFWNNDSSTRICILCNYLNFFHPEAFIKMHNSQIFINAPSFKIMYHLNKFLKEITGENKMELRSKRGLLAMSVIEYATRIKTTLGQWSTMNIEVVSKTTHKIKNKRKVEIDFFAVPNDVMQLLTNRNIAGQLKTIGEFSILNLVLDRKYNRLTEVGYRLMRESMKSNNRDDVYINKWIYSNNNQRRIGEVAQQIFKLYALIDERIKHVNKFSKNKEYAN